MVAQNLDAFALGIACSTSLTAWQAKDKVERKIEAYNQAVTSINSCLEAIGLDDKLPVITEADSSMALTVKNTNIAALAAGRTIKQKTLRTQGFVQQTLKKK